MRIRYSLFVMLAVWLLSAFPLSGWAADGSSPSQLVNALKQGGYTIYFRHAATDWSQSDTVHAPGDWRSCDGSKIRQLSDAGRETAKRIGAAMRALALPIGEVLSSEYCRAVETARLMDLGAVRTTTDIMNLRAASFVGGRDAAVRRYQAIIATPPQPGVNRVISAHGNLSREATGAYPDEAGAVIIVADPKAERGFRVLGMLEPSDWDLVRR